MLKVITESAALTDEQIVSCCQAAERAGADFVKTSTGFHPAGGASVEAVALMARTVGVEPQIVHVPLALARRQRPPLLHWGEALVGGAVFATGQAAADLDWRPAFGLEDGYRSSYEWFDQEGRDLFEYDFARDADLLAQLDR